MAPEQPSTAGDWQRVLTRVEQALTHAVEQIQLREQSLSAADRGPPLPQLAWHGLQQRQDALQSYPAQANRNLAELDSLLSASEEALRQWLTQAETLRRRLPLAIRGS